MRKKSAHLYNAALQLDRASERRRLTSIGISNVVQGVLRDFAAREATVYVWLMMTDHIHILFSTPRPHDDLATYLGRIKRRISNGLVRRGQQPMNWRDGVVQYPVTWAEVSGARDYILQNPVRGQYVADHSQWPHKDTPAPLPGL